MGWNFLSCFGDETDHPKGASLAVTADNLKDNLWPEFAKWKKLSPFLDQTFEWTKSRIYQKDHPETWFMSARSYSKDADAESQGRALSGLHSKYVLVLLDESGDIPEPVLKTAEQALSRCVFGKIVQAGNPSSLDGILYLACNKLRKKWFIITITGDPDDPERSPRIDIVWARDQIELYGRDDPWVMYSILGLFPPSSINALLGIADVEAAMDRHYPESEIMYSQKRLGVDMAREGDDRTVIFPRQGLVAYNPVVMRNVDGPQVAARVALAKKRWGSEMEFIDCTGGFGDSVYDQLVQAGITSSRVHFAGKSIADGYKNRRAEMWWNMAQWVKRGGCLPNVGELVPELTAPTYTFSNGKLMLEPKEKIKKRLKKSPDLGDALALTFAIEEMQCEAATPLAGQNDTNFADHKFDPLEY